MRVRSRIVIVVCFVSLAGLVGCSRAMNGADDHPRNVITAAEIEQAQASTAYDLVAKFRANFLRSRGQNSVLLKEPREPTVYLDNVEYGTVASLRQIPASTISEIRFIEGWDAMSKYGSNHVSGVIQIFTRYQ